MRLAYRRSVTAYILLVCWSCQQCSGFLGAPRQSSVYRKHDRLSGGHVRSLGVPLSPSSRPRETRMMAAPAELWDSYLHALEAAPLLTKVWDCTACQRCSGLRLPNVLCMYPAVVRDHSLGR